MSLSFYEKAFANNYEELITYYPAFYQQVYEMQEILKAQGKLADGVEAGIERAYLNNFIDYADAETIGNLETFLRLEHNRTKELEMRRRIVKAHFIGNGKMSATLIKSMLQAYTEAEVDIELKAYNADSGEGRYLYLDGQTLFDGSRLLDDAGTKTYNGQTQALYITLFRDGTTKVFTSDILELLKDKLPGHLMFVLSDYTETTADCRNLEKIFFSHMRMSTRIPFWNTEYLDGTKHLDGSQTLNKRRYICTPGLQYNEKIRHKPESIIPTALMETGAGFYEKSNVQLSGSSISQRVDAWSSNYLNGEIPLDGSKDLNAARGHRKVNTEILSGINTGKEVIGEGSVVSEINLHFMDGSLLFSGSTTLNSFYKKEAF